MNSNIYIAASFAKSNGIVTADTYPVIEDFFKTFPCFEVVNFSVDVFIFILIV